VCWRHICAEDLQSPVFCSRAAARVPEEDGGMEEGAAGETQDTIKYRKEAVKCQEETEQDQQEADQ